MKVSLKWLRDYVKIVVPPEELAHRLTMSGTEVSGIDKVGGSWERVVVGQVVRLERHPNADRLLLATIDLGGRSLTVVSGAPNMNVGDKVPFAHVGAKLIDGHSGQLVELKPAKIRGVYSEGMACSEKELGISDRHEGIMVLPADAPVGIPLADYLGDVIFDLKLTPNRPDCLSVIGVAREVAALTGQEVRLPELAYDEPGPPIESLIAVEILDPDLCPRYLASLVSEVCIGPSPPWMQERLIASGMRPINNVVDITNYVMLEYGQPLHAFDYTRLKGQRILVRRARQGEVLMTLDGTPRNLARDMLVIADAEEPVAVAGVMGGAASEVTEATTTVLLEAANFNNISLRRTSSQLGMRTEASLRFEKGLDPELAWHGLKRATRLFVELAGGRAARGIADAYPGRRERETIRLTAARARKVLGVELGAARMAEVLGSLGFECHREGPDLLVKSPYWRTDIKLADDLVEELARIIGYDEIPTTTLSGQVPRYQPDPARELQEQVRDIMASCGIQEVITYSLTSLTMLGKAYPDGQLRGPTPLRVINPLSAEQEYLRTSLRASLLATLGANLRHEVDGIRLFEVGRVYLPREGQLPEERQVVAGVLCGPRLGRSWVDDKGELGFFDAKHVIEVLLWHLGAEASFEATEDDMLLRGRAARVVVAGEALGLLGEVDPRVAANFDISLGPVCFFDLDLDKMVLLFKVTRKYRPIPRYPGTMRHIALVVDADLPQAKVRELLLASPLVSEVTLFDVYTGEQVPPGKKSLAYSIVYQSPERTLTDEEVDALQANMLQRLEREIGAKLRR